MDVLGRDVTLAALSMSQQALTKRLELISQNIANVNTPDYKRRDISFIDELSTALDAPAASREERVANLGQAVAREIVEERLFLRPDLGGVDIDREMAELAKTQMRLNATHMLAYRKIRQYRTVIKEGRV
ncbi:flagellar basal body rod protein FlgB [bacterium]|nr:flagellar basal body rod protein FlgB [bacterium]